MVDADTGRTVLERLPRDPEAVVARALALDDEARLLGGRPEDEGFLLLHARRGVAHLVGRMEPDALAEALDEARAETERAGAPRRVLYSLGTADDASGAEEVGLRPELLHLRALRTLDRVPPFVGAAGPPPRRLSPEGVAALEPLPPELQATLEAALERPPPVFGVVLEGRVASFACSFWTGDFWWDMSVDTLPDFRRRGLGTACAVELIRALAPRGLRPVNAPETGSGGAPAFLAYLGFQEAGTLVRWRAGG